MEVTLIFGPVLVYVVHVVPVEAVVAHFVGYLVVEDSLAVELIILPHSLVGQLTTLVV